MVASTFRSRVLHAVRRIPLGRVATYGDIAEVAGRPGAARAVGTIMAGASSGEAPCHRVVAAGGKLGGFGGREDLKRTLLRAEGVVVVGGMIRRFATIRWPAPAGTRTRPEPYLPHEELCGRRVRRPGNQPPP